MAKTSVIVAKLRTNWAEYVAKRPHRSFKRTVGARPKLGGKPLPNPWRLLVATTSLLWREKKIVLGLGAIYGIASYLVVGGISQVDFLGLKEAATQVLAGDTDSFSTAGTLFLAAISGSIAPPPTEFQQLLAGLLAFIFWLALIWALRMRLADKPVRIRDALYNCCSPLIPSLLVLVATVLQLLPGLLGVAALSIAQGNGYVQGGVEAMVFTVVAGLLCLLSLYWASSSIMGLVIVSLPQTYPWQALSAGSRLVIGQRWRLLLHLVVLIAVIFLVWAVLLLPSLLLDGWLRFDWLPLIPVMAQLLSAFTLVFGTAYIFRLYRSLL